MAGDSEIQASSKQAVQVHLKTWIVVIVRVSSFVLIRPILTII
jgi:hypothetical protein